MKILSFNTQSHFVPTSVVFDASEDQSQYAKKQVSIDHISGVLSIFD